MGQRLRALRSQLSDEAKEASKIEDKQESAPPTSETHEGASRSKTLCFEGLSLFISLILIV